MKNTIAIMKAIKEITERMKVIDAMFDYWGSLADTTKYGYTLATNDTEEDIDVAVCMDVEESEMGKELTYLLKAVKEIKERGGRVDLVVGCQSENGYRERKLRL